MARPGPARPARRAYENSGIAHVDTQYSKFSGVVEPPTEASIREDKYSDNFYYSALQPNLLSSLGVAVLQSAERERGSDSLSVQAVVKSF